MTITAQKLITVSDWLSAHPDLHSSVRHAIFQQLDFVEGNLSPLAAPVRNYLHIVGEHLMGNEPFPVWYFGNESLEIVMREKGGGWVISYSGPPVTLGYSEDLFLNKENIASHYAEGIPLDCLYQNYADGSEKFTVKVSYYALHTFCFLLIEALTQG